MLLLCLNFLKAVIVRKTGAFVAYKAVAVKTIIKKTFTIAVQEETTHRQELSLITKYTQRCEHLILSHNLKPKH